VARVAGSCLRLAGATVVVFTPSGVITPLSSCPQVEGNQKLASWEAVRRREEEPDIAGRTRGEGGWHSCNFLSPSHEE